MSSPLNRLESFKNFFPASAFAPDFDLLGNSQTVSPDPAMSPLLPSELLNYTYPSLYLQSFEDSLINNGATCRDSTPNFDVNPSLHLNLSHQETVGSPSLPISDAFDESEPLTNYPPGITTRGDQDWYAFMAESGLSLDML